MKVKTLKLCDLMSYSANGTRWQVWTLQIEPFDCLDSAPNSSLDFLRKPGRFWSSKWQQLLRLETRAGNEGKNEAVGRADFVPRTGTALAAKGLITPFSVSEGMSGTSR